ncbi:MAG: hypothetical protein KGI88_07020 [Betaproteobacteria bacterium]|nr:hypothetical protein [Betaproteobacteria bacterium]
MRISEFLSDDEKLKLLKLIFTNTFKELEQNTTNSVKSNSQLQQPKPAVNKPIPPKPVPPSTPLQRISNKAKQAQLRKTKPIAKPLPKAQPKRIPNPPAPKPFPQPKPQPVTPTQYKKQVKQQNQNLAKEIGKTITDRDKTMVSPINPILPDRFNTATNKIDGDLEQRIRKINSQVKP